MRELALTLCILSLLLVACQSQQDLQPTDSATPLVAAQVRRVTPAEAGAGSGPVPQWSSPPAKFDVAVADDTSAHAEKDDSDDSFASDGSEPVSSDGGDSAKDSPAPLLSGGCVCAGFPSGDAIGSHCSRWDDDCGPRGWCYVARFACGSQGIHSILYPGFDWSCVPCQQDDSAGSNSPAPEEIDPNRSQSEKGTPTPLLGGSNADWDDYISSSGGDASSGGMFWDSGDGGEPWFDNINAPDSPSTAVSSPSTAGQLPTGGPNAHSPAPDKVDPDGPQDGVGSTPTALWEESGQEDGSRGEDEGGDSESREIHAPDSPPTVPSQTPVVPSPAFTIAPSPPATSNTPASGRVSPSTASTAPASSSPTQGTGGSASSPATTTDVPSPVTGGGSPSPSPVASTADAEESSPSVDSGSAATSSPLPTSITQDGPSALVWGISIIGGLAVVGLLAALGVWFLRYRQPDMPKLQRFHDVADIAVSETPQHHGV